MQPIKQRRRGKSNFRPDQEFAYKRIETAAIDNQDCLLQRDEDNPWSDFLNLPKSEREKQLQELEKVLSRPLEQINVQELMKEIDDICE